MPTVGRVSQRLSNMSVVETLFLFAFALWLLFSVLNTSFYAEYIPYRQVRYVSLLMVLLVEVIGSRHSLYSIIGLAIALIMSVCILNSGMRSLLDAVIFVYCGRNLPFRMIAKIALVVTTVGFLIVVCSALLGLIPNYISISETRYREYLGFRYALFSSEYLFAITGLLVYLREYRLKAFDVIMLLLANWWLFQRTNSRLSFYLAVVLIACAVLCQFDRGKLLEKAPVGLVLCFCYVVAAVVSIAVTDAYDPFSQLMLDLNDFFGNRLDYGKDALLTYGFTSFGQEVHMVGAGLTIEGERNYSIVYNYVDCFYLKILLQQGAVYLILFLALMTAVCRSAWKDGKYILFIVLVIFALHGMVDDLISYLYYNPFLFLIGGLISESRSPAFHILKKSKSGSIDASYLNRSLEGFSAKSDAFALRSGKTAVLKNIK